MAAIYAQPTPDENLVSGWTVQGNINPGGETGYAQAGVTGTTTNVGQAGAGFPLPAGAMNANPNENSAAYSESVLENGSYSVTPTTQIGQTLAVTVGVSPATVANPFGTSAVLAITGGTETSITMTPKGGTAATTIANGAIVPPGASVIITYSAAPTSVAFVSTH